MATNPFPPISAFIRGMSRRMFDLPAEDLQLFKLHAWRLDHNTLATEHALMRAMLTRLRDEATDPKKRQPIASLLLMLQGSPQ